MVEATNKKFLKIIYLDKLLIIFSANIQKN